MSDVAALAELERRVAELEAGRLESSSADVWWLVSNGLIVFFMQCGFGMLEAGSVTARATQNILLKNLLDTSMSAVVWYTMGFGVAFDGDNPFIGVAVTPSANGSSTLFLSYRMQLDDVAGATTDGTSMGYNWAFWWFQFTFAAAAATIVSGAVAERALLVAYLIYSTIITLIIYPVVAHWAWSGAGFLSAANDAALLGGVADFAGSGVVHLTGGVAALCGAAVIGPRTGRFMRVPVPDYEELRGCGRWWCFRPRTEKPLPMPGHSSVLQALGTFILWMGWYGFNAGSTLAINGSSTATAARIFVTTTLSASCGGITAVVLERARGAGKQWDVAAMCNGVLAGLVSITAGCATCPPWSAIVIGTVGGCVLRLSSLLVLEMLLVDDPLDAFAVHGACGAWGILACAIFSTEYYTLAVYGATRSGLIYGGGEMLCAAIVFIICIVAWAGSNSLVIFLSLRKLGILRIGDASKDAVSGVMIESGHVRPTS